MSRIRKFFFLFCFIFLIQNTYATRLVIGALSYQSPLAPNEISMFLGFEITLMEEICRRIHADCHFESVNFNQITEKMNSGDVDLVFGSIIITKAKRKNFLFSLPYQESHLQYITLNKSKLETIQQLTGKTIGVHLRCPSRNIALKHMESGIQVSDLPATLNLLTALENNEISAVLTHYHQAKQWVKSKRKLKLLGYKFRIGDGYGIMTKLGRNELMQQINQALLDIENDGTYLRFYQNYL